jgi:N-acetylglutamate synthase-like GNAT family acetyltransferase
VQLMLATGTITMQSQRKPFSRANDAEPIPGRHQGHRHFTTSNVVQPKSSIATLAKKPPAAPPVYRPGPAQTITPAKTANGARQNPAPAPPLAYRPQLPPKAVQPKTEGAPQMRKPPTAPPIYRPQPAPLVLQTKLVGAAIAATGKTGVMPVRVSTPMRTGTGSYRITAGTGSQHIGSVMVHERDKSSIEVTDLGVDPEHRKQNLGARLMASALRTGLQMGKTRVVLNSQDNGSGHLTQWYQSMGFARTGSSRRGYPQLAASISQVLPKVMQRQRTPTERLSVPMAATGKGVKPKSLQLSRPSLPGANPMPKLPPGRQTVLQMMDSDELSSHYGSGYWPPPASPVHAPPTPSGEYYAYATDYYSQRDAERGDQWMDAYEDYTGASVGQTTGTKESDDFDASYVEVPDQCRPSAPGNLWKLVYQGLVNSTKYPGWLVITCAELSDGKVYVDANTKCESGTGKKPPMCHKIPFNHIRYAAQWLFDNKLHPTAQGYKGPDAAGYDWDTWKSLVWHISNLQPGHAKCNSQTASSAKGTPKGPAEQKAIQYAITRLKALQPTWF